MDAIELLTTRASNPKLSEPGPDAQTLRLAMAAAARAPDHKLLRPCRVFLIQGQAREALGEVLAAILGEADPQASQEELDKMRLKPLRAPLVMAVAARVQDNEKVPAVEQILTAGAAAQNILLTLHARGYAGIWRTGSPAYHPRMKAAFGLSDNDALVGFLYAGTPALEAPQMRRPDPASLATDWTGPIGVPPVAAD